LADSFELAFSNKEAWLAAPENWRKGIEYIYSNLIGIMEAHNLIEINPLRQTFNPAEHHSIATVETNKPPEDNLVLEVLKKGYRLGAKVIRPAHVKVGVLKN
jgi:molecular chaperone GrpE